MLKLLSATENDTYHQTVESLLSNGMMPLWFAPMLFCGVPGDESAINPDMGPCYEHVARNIAAGIRDRTLPFIRHPYSWMFDDFEPITPEWIIDCYSLDEWSYAYYGLRTGLEDWFQGEARDLCESSFTPNEIGAKLKARMERIQCALAEHGHTALTAPRGFKKRLRHQLQADEPALFGSLAIGHGSSFDKAWTALRQNELIHSENSEK